MKTTWDDVNCELAYSNSLRSTAVSAASSSRCRWVRVRRRVEFYVSGRSGSRQTTSVVDHHDVPHDMTSRGVCPAFLSFLPEEPKGRTEAPASWRGRMRPRWLAFAQVAVGEEHRPGRGSGARGSHPKQQAVEAVAPEGQGACRKKQCKYGF